MGASLQPYKKEYNMSGFFGITESDLKDGKAKFNGGDVAEMVISSIVKKEIKGNPTIIVECVVTQGGTNVGLKYAEFFRPSSDGGRKALGIFLTSFMSAQEAAAMQDPNVLINRKFSCKFVADGQYVNMRSVQSVSDVPAGMGTGTSVPPQPQTAPQAQVNAMAPDTPVLSKSLF